MAKKEQLEKRPDDSDFEVDDRTMSKQFARLPALVAHWSNEYADAFGAWKRAKLHNETTYAKTYVRLRDEAEAERSKVTEATLKAMVQSDVGVIAAAELLIMAETRKVRCQGYLDSFATKRDALVSLGANHRAELGAHVSLTGKPEGGDEDDDLDDDDD